MCRRIFEPLFWIFRLRRYYRSYYYLREIKSILIVRLDEIGDFVLSTPLIRELRRNAPDAWITLIVKPGVFNLAEKCPYVDEVLQFDRSIRGDRHRRLRHYPRVIWHYRAIRLSMFRLWHRRIDLAISPRRGEDTYHSTFLTYFSGARRRVGYSEHLTRNKAVQLQNMNCLLTDVLESPPDQHEVHQNLNVLKHLGGIVDSDEVELWLTDEDHVFAKKFIANNGGGAGVVWIAISPGTTVKQKAWPVDRFGRLAARLINDYHCRILIVGGPEDQFLAEEIRQIAGNLVVNGVGRTTLRQTAALLSQCRLMITNCTGPMHIAAAMKTPVVELCCHPRSGSPANVRSPVRFGPWGTRSIVVQPEKPLAPCTDGCQFMEPHCITQISEGDALSAIQIMMASSI